MKQEHSRYSFMTVGVVAAVIAVAGQSASAQTAGTTTSPTSATTAESAGVLTTTSRTSKPATATAEMIHEAIQRSRSRSEKARLNGTPEQFGSEEPFTYDPAK